MANLSASSAYRRPQSHRTIPQDEFSDTSDDETDSFDESSLVRQAPAYPRSCVCDDTTPMKIIPNETVDPFGSASITISCERTLKRTDSDINKDQALLSDYANTFGEEISIQSTQTKLLNELLDITNLQPYQLERELKRANLAKKRQDVPTIEADPFTPFKNLLDDLYVELDSPFALLEHWLPSFYHLLPHENGQINGNLDDFYADLPHYRSREDIAPEVDPASSTYLPPSLDNANPLTAFRTNSDFPGSEWRNEQTPLWTACEAVIQSTLEILGVAEADLDFSVFSPDVTGQSKSSNTSPLPPLPRTINELSNAVFGARPNYTWWELIRPSILELSRLTGRPSFYYSEILEVIQSKFLYFAAENTADKALSSMAMMLRQCPKGFIRYEHYEGKAKRLTFGCDVTIDPRIRVYKKAANGQTDAAEGSNTVSMSSSDAKSTFQPAVVVMSKPSSNVLQKQQMEPAENAIPLTVNSDDSAAMDVTASSKKSKGRKRKRAVNSIDARPYRDMEVQHEQISAPSTIPSKPKKPKHRKRKQRPEEEDQPSQVFETLLAEMEKAAAQVEKRLDEVLDVAEQVEKQVIQVKEGRRSEKRKEGHRLKKRKLLE